MLFCLDRAVHECSPVRGYDIFLRQHSCSPVLLVVKVVLGTPGDANWPKIISLSRRYRRRARDGSGGELVVVGQAVLVRLLKLRRQLRVLALCRFDAGALLSR